MTDGDNIEDECRHSGTFVKIQQVKTEWNDDFQIWILQNRELLRQEYIQHVLHVRAHIRKVIHGTKYLALLLLLPKNRLIRRIWACFFSPNHLFLIPTHYLHCTVPSRPNKHHWRTANLNFDRSHGGCGRIWGLVGLWQREQTLSAICEWICQWGKPCALVMWETSSGGIV